MKFADLKPPDSPATQAVNQARDAVLDKLIEDNRNTVIPADRLPCLQAVASWSLLLTERTDPQKRQIREYMDVVGGVGGLGSLVAGALKGDFSQVNSVAQRILGDIYTEAVQPEWLADASKHDVKRRYSELTIPQVRLLQEIVKHRLRLEALDLSDLALKVPFPLDAGSYLWRFLAGGAHTPEHAARCISESTPFLVTMANLCRRLAADSNNVIIVSGERTNQATLYGDEDDILGILQEFINISHEFYGHSRARDVPRLHVLRVPYLPPISAEHIPKADRAELASALYGWLLFGDKHSEILKRPPISPEKEAHLRGLRQKIEQSSDELNRLAPSNISEGNSQTAAEIAKLQTKIKNTQSLLTKEELALADKRPLIQQLEGDAKHNIQLRAFRRDFRKAQAAGVKPILYFGDEGQCQNVLIEHLDHALGNIDRRVSSGGPDGAVADALKGCSFLFGEAPGDALKSSWTGEQERYTRMNFSMWPLIFEEFANQSVRALLAGVVPQRERWEIGVLLGIAIGRRLLPGILSQHGLIRQVRFDLNKRHPTATDYFCYLCSESKQIDPDAMMRMLAVLQRLGVTRIPEETAQLCQARFDLPISMFRQYEEFVRQYRPQLFGSLGNSFDHLTSFEFYREVGLETIGMDEEVRLLEEGLKGSSVVAVVDGTSYYPEYKGRSPYSPVETKEVWGAYAPPTARLVQSLAFRVMRGDVAPELRDYSIVIPAGNSASGEELSPLLKALLGLEVSSGESKRCIEQQIAELARYNEKAIVVLDATQVKDIRDYRRLLESLERYGLKAILCSHAQFPGRASVDVNLFERDTLVERITHNPVDLQRVLGLAEAPSREVIEQAVAGVKRAAPQDADPLHLSLQVLRFAAVNAQTNGANRIIRRDIVEAHSKIFDEPSPTKMFGYIQGIGAFEREARITALGQGRAITEISQLMTQHMARLTSGRSPAVGLLTGPTGTGKTMLARLVAKNVGLPLAELEGSQHTSEHMVSNLIGSPADYRGPDWGRLFKFAYDNPHGMVFMDEFEKFHPTILTFFMNFLDEGKLKSGDGTVISRPGLSFLLASNAGALQLRSGMAEREIKNILGQAFARGPGGSMDFSRAPNNPMDYLVARMQVIPVLALEHSAFRAAIHKNLQDIGGWQGVISANLRLQEVDPSACDILFAATETVCRFDQDGTEGQGSFGFNTQADSRGASEDNRYFDLRHLEKTTSRLVGGSLSTLTHEQYQSGRFNDRSRVWPFRLVGDSSTGLIRAELIQ